ncbi:MAG: hypothetical protein H0X66_05990 [Verrucomicrobia bacterium]|nr:hypothetical protein [Verrucomicrobiota bacterium]
MSRWLLLLTCVFLAGCATSTVESRRAEKMSSYATFSPEIQRLVDSGQITVGMPADAVYIAWGAPSEILQSEDARGAATTWLYHGTYMQQYRYWNYREVANADGVFLERYLDTEYNPRSFLHAEITFQGGVVKSWRTLPRPH